MNKLLLGALLGTSCLLFACNDNSAKKTPDPIVAEYGPDEALTADTSIVLDSSLMPEERARIRDDFTRLTQLEMDGLSPTGLVQKVFNGTDANSFVKFIDDRVNVIVSSRISLDDRMSVDFLKNLSFKTLDAWAKQLYAEGGAVLMATNLSPVIWLYSLQKNGPKYFRLASGDLPISSSHVGIMRIGEGYMRDDDANGFSRVERMGTLIHESRHSDCTGGITRSMVSRIQSNSADAIKAFQSTTCGHPHIECPAGHPLANLPACDSRPWGAYSTEAVFGLAVSKYCKNCSEQENQDATLLLGEALSRLTLSATSQTAWTEDTMTQDVKDMLAGKYGEPDMTSSGVIEGK